MSEDKRYTDAVRDLTKSKAEVERLRRELRKYAPALADVQPELADRVHRFHIDAYVALRSDREEPPSIDETSALVREAERIIDALVIEVAGEPCPHNIRRRVGDAWKCTYCDKVTNRSEPK